MSIQTTIEKLVMQKPARVFIVVQPEKTWTAYDESGGIVTQGVMTELNDFMENNVVVPVYNGVPEF